MKALIGVIIIVVLAAGAWYWYAGMPSATSDIPSGSAGLNGSPDQGNLGGADTGTPQQPGGDGSSVADNLTLGLDASAELGSYLIAYNGMTLYMYTEDTAGVSKCSGNCAVNWPPYTVPAGTTINAQAGVTGSFATIARADGTMQVTYKGMPLYFYIKDTKSGDTTGQGVNDVWYVVKP